MSTDVGDIGHVRKLPCTLNLWNACISRLSAKMNRATRRLAPMRSIECFAALARHAQRVRRARVVLRWVARDGTNDIVVCVVTVTLEPSGFVRTRAQGQHAYAAINRAAERIGELMRRRAA